MKTAKFVQEVTVTDPITGGEVQVSIFKDDSSGGMFGVDSSFIEQSFDDDDDDVVVNSPLSFLRDSSVTLEGV
jgi:hypothetical protein